MPRKFLVTLTLLHLCFGATLSQTVFRKAPVKPPVICKAGTGSGSGTHIPPPAEFLRAAGNGRTKSATITVEYFGFPAQARQAFEHAISIWESLLVTPVEIRVAAVWANLPEGTLGAAGPAYWAANFDGAPRLNIYYPAALAEKLAGTDLNGPDEYDIVAQFNSSANWHFGISGTPNEGELDLVTIVLHELGHGLGFTSTFQIAGGQGMHGRYTDEGIPFPYDLFLESGTGINIYSALPSPSPELYQQLTSNNLFFASPSGNRVAKIFAPNPYAEGSSISHLDAASYPQGTQNSLMRPFVNANEVNHNPGPLTLKILADMGWVTTYIDHEHLADREDVTTPIAVSATISADGTPGYDFDDAAVTLTYSRSDIPGTTEVLMQPGGQTGEFVAMLPAPMSAVTYSYSISVPDDRGRVMYSPGLHHDPNSDPGAKGPSVVHYTFNVGPDNTPPVIAHTPRAFISYLEDELVIDVTLTDGSGISEATIELIVADNPQGSAPLELVSSDRELFEGTTAHHYRKTVPLSAGTLEDGDVIQYRITAIDNASSRNASTYPTTGFAEVPVEGLAPSRTHYVNNFNTPSDDFIGNDFTITTAAGFASPAIHSPHPYPQAGANNELDLVYQLRIPIVVGATSSTMHFDEVAIIEPGENGSTFGSPDFYDYVVVEGSADGGHTWVPLADGYDARDQAAWLSAYNASTAGSPTQFRTRHIDLRNTFNTGEVVVIRFRLHSDPFSAGWGWVIDNLHIQTDDVAPDILHHHVDYLPIGTSTVSLPVTVTDAGRVDQLAFEYAANDQPLQRSEHNLNQSEALVDFALDIQALKAGDIIYYRYDAVDSAGNVATLPPDGFFKIPIVAFGEAIDQYSNTFDTPTNDFAGNFFEVTSTAALPSAGIHSRHPYLPGFGTTRESDFSYTLLRKIRISSDNPYMKFDEVVLVQPADEGAPFGTSEFRDYVTIEGSKDEGKTWHVLADGYNAGAHDEWKAAFGVDIGRQQHVRRRSFDLTASGNFVAGDEILIRFRMFSDETVTGWGWYIDDLHIQDEVTSVPSDGIVAKLLVYPNPITDADQLTIGMQPQTHGTLHVSILNATGREVYRNEFLADPVMKDYPLDIGSLANGIYLLRLKFGSETITRKVLVSR